MKHFLGKVRDKSSSTSISYEGAHVNKPVEIANCFNHHFSTITKKLTDKLPLFASKFTDYFPPPNPSSMFMTPTNIVEIKRFICELKPKLSAGCCVTDRKIRARRNSKALLAKHLMFPPNLKYLEFILESF